MSGQWPPEWDDPEDISGEADQQDTEAETGLSEVAAYLASVPALVMPGSVEARISAALAVEAATRAGVVPTSGGAKGDGTAEPATTSSDGAAGARVLGPAPARARVRRRDIPGRRRERETRKIFEPRRRRDVREVLGKFVLGPLAVCLLLVIIVLGLSHSESSSSSSSASSLGLAPQAAGAASSAPAYNGVNKGSAASGRVTAAPASSAAASAAASAFSSAAGFAVSQTGTSYQKATLAQQALAQVHAVQSKGSGPTSVPSASSSSASGSIASLSSSVPTAQLRACVLKVTGGVVPELVDRAAYQGTHAYVIATSRHVWVVGLGCTAARPQVIASVPLAG